MTLNTQGLNTDEIIQFMTAEELDFACAQDSATNSNSVSFKAGICSLTLQVLEGFPRPPLRQEMEHPR